MLWSIALLSKAGLSTARHASAIARRSLSCQVLLVVGLVALAWDLVAAGFSFEAVDLPSVMAGAVESFLAASLYFSLR